MQHPTSEVFTNSTCYNNRKLNARSGHKIWYRLNNKRNLALRVPGNTQSNQVGEIVVVIAAVNTTPPF